MSQRFIMIGGGDYRKDELLEVGKSLFDKTSREDCILIIPWAAEEVKQNKWLEVMVNHFSKLGFNKINCLKSDSSPEEIIRQIGEANILFFTGGRPERLIKSLTRYLTLLKQKEDVLLIGYSAGALAFCKDCVITKDEDYPCSIIIDGLGLIPFSVSVHYEVDQDQDLKELSDRRKIYGLPELSVLTYEGSSFQKFGPVCVFKNQKKEWIEEERWN